MNKLVKMVSLLNEILPMAQPMVRALGVYRDEIPAEKEAPL